MSKPREGHSMWASGNPKDGTENKGWVVVEEAATGLIRLRVRGIDVTMNLDEAELHMNQMRRIIDRQKGRYAKVDAP